MKNVLLIDSGCGGVNVLKECEKTCPYCNFLLFCDGKNLPYGTKSCEELWKLTKNNLMCLKSMFDFQVVVFACNTLSSTCLERARECFCGVQFVGTVPAVKPACEEYERENVCLIATPSTLANCKLLKEYDGIKKVPCDLASYIDENLDHLEKIEQHVVSFLEKNNILENANVKALVLGCTHYKAIEKMLQKHLANVKIFDSASGVACRLQSVCNAETGDFSAKIICSKREDWAKFWQFYCQK